VDLLQAIIAGKWGKCQQRHRFATLCHWKVHIFCAQLILTFHIFPPSSSPISDTTVLTSLACDCQLLSHVVTQAPYVLFTVFVSIILGTIPIGYSDMPNIVGILLGWLVLILFVYFVCVPVLSPTGRYDVFTEILLKVKQRRGQESELFQLKQDTISYLQEGSPVEAPKKLEESDRLDVQEDVMKGDDVEEDVMKGDDDLEPVDIADTNEDEVAAS